jgi:hypothetical protein
MKTNIQTDIRFLPHGNGLPETGDELLAYTREIIAHALFQRPAADVERDIERARAFLRGNGEPASATLRRLFGEPEA